MNSQILPTINYLNYLNLNVAVVYTTNVTADENVDYIPKSDYPVTVPFGDTVDVDINITDDDVMEPEETFTINVGGPGVGDVLTTVAIKIIDNDRK